MNKFQLLGEAIRRRRKVVGLTQAELAVLAGCSVPFIIQVEDGKSSVRFDKLIEVLETLGLELQLGRGKEGISVNTRSQAG